MIHLLLLLILLMLVPRCILRGCGCLLLAGIGAVLLATLFAH
jgi:hypothetical protein